MEYLSGLSNFERLGDIPHLIKCGELEMMKMFMFKPMKPTEALFSSDDMNKMRKEQQKLENQWVTSRADKQ